MERTAYETRFIEDAILVIAATDDRAVNEKVFQDCRARRILCNVVDIPDLCDFYVPAIVKRGVLQIAIGTDGYSPAYASQLRQKLEREITEQHGEFVNHLRQMRMRVLEEVPVPLRKDLLIEMAKEPSFEVFRKEGPEAWQQHAHQMIDDAKG
jgi:precorrin-2 dehydrogenase/sirohydrochlorin ferrochelatase